MTKRLITALELLTFIIVGFVLLLLALPVHAQSRVVTETAAATWSELHCTRNADATVECSVGVTITADDGTSRVELSRPLRLVAPVNVNRAQNLGDALYGRALARFNVDGGAP